MGSSCGREDPRSRLVAQELLDAEGESRNIHKLLLLGPGNSGKSTFFKQIRDVYGEGWTHEQRLRFRQNVYDSIVDQMQMLLSLVQDDFEVDLSRPLADYRGAASLRPARVSLPNNGTVTAEKSEEKSIGKEVSLEPPDFDERMSSSSERRTHSFDDLEAAAMYVEALCRGVRINRRIAKALALVWADTRVKDVFDCRDRIGVADSCPYFFDSIDRFAEKDYVPSMDDILLVRNSTVGIRETDFQVGDDHFEIFDVGGQRGERQKWIHIFDNVCAVLFVTSLSCYDQVLYEDESVNAMEESLDLWEEVCNSEHFANDGTSLVIFFNKKDIFEEKIKTKPITQVFPGYDGPPEYKPAYEYIMKEFESKQTLFEQRTMYCHATTATDKANVQRVLSDVTHHAVVNALRVNGIM